MVCDPLAEGAVFVVHHIDRVPVVGLFSLVATQPVLGFVVIDAS
jgi:hypothetical protein